MPTPIVLPRAQVIGEVALVKTIKSPIRVRCSGVSKGQAKGRMLCVSGELYRSILERAIDAEGTGTDDASFLGSLPCCRTIGALARRALAKLLTYKLCGDIEETRSAFEGAVESGAWFIMKAGSLRFPLVRPREERESNATQVAQREVILRPGDVLGPEAIRIVAKCIGSTAGSDGAGVTNGAALLELTKQDASSEAVPAPIQLEAERCMLIKVRRPTRRMQLMCK